MAESEIQHLTFIEKILGSTDLRNNWETNGYSYMTRIGSTVIVHISIRRGTTTDGTVALIVPEEFRPPNHNQSLVIISGLNKVVNGYVTFSTIGEMKIYSVTDANNVTIDGMYLMN